ncbi:MAG: competence protein ComEA [Phycisphaerales bacterium]|nr:competence protein ComEA [Phycisphaerales bacterium]
MADQPEKPAFVWTPTQRGVLIAFVLILSSILLIRLAYNRMYVSNPPPARGERFEELADRIDPNVATWQELSVLPQIGEKRAKQIIAYREEFVACKPNGVAFARPQDLMEVKGIGPAMLETLRPHLMFPSTQPTTLHSR